MRKLARQKQLIVNADGYGFTAASTAASKRRSRAASSPRMSVNANFDTVWPLRELIARKPEISVGVHLNPVAGRPIADPADVPTLVDASGEFHFDQFTPRLQAGQIDPAELRHELGLQIARVRGWCLS